MANIENAIIKNPEKNTANLAKSDVTTKLLREATTVGSALVDGTVKGVENLPHDIPQMAASLGIGGVMGVVAKTGPLGEAGVAVAGGVMVSAWAYSEYKNDWGKFSNAISNTWHSDKNLQVNKTAIQDTLGSFLGQSILYGYLGKKGFDFGAKTIAPSLSNLSDKYGVTNIFKDNLEPKGIVAGKPLELADIAETSLSAKASSEALLKTAHEIANPPKSYDGLDGLTKLQRDKLIASDPAASALKTNLSEQLKALKENDATTTKLNGEIKEIKTSISKLERLQTEHDGLKLAKDRLAMFEQDKAKLTANEEAIKQVNEKIDTEKLAQDIALKGVKHSKDIPPSPDLQRLMDEKQSLTLQNKELKNLTSEVVLKAIQQDVSSHEQQLAQATQEAPAKIEALKSSLSQKQTQLELMQNNRPNILGNIQNLVDNLNAKHADLLAAQRQADEARILAKVNEPVKPKQLNVPANDNNPGAEVVSAKATPEINVKPVVTDHVIKAPAANDNVATASKPETADTATVIKPVDKGSEVQLKTNAEVVNSVAKSLSEAKSDVKALSDQRTLKYVEHQATDRLNEIKSSTFVDEASKAKAIASAEQRLAMARENVAKSGKPKFLDALNSLVRYAKALDSDKSQITDTSVGDLQKMLTKVTSKNFDSVKYNSLDSNQAKLEYMIKSIDKSLNSDILRNSSFAGLITDLENGSISDKGMAFVMDKNGKLLNWTDREGESYPMVIDLSRLAQSGMSRDGGWLDRFRNSIKQDNVGGIVIKEPHVDDNGNVITQMHYKTGKPFVPTYITKVIGQVPDWLSTQLIDKKEMPYNEFLRELQKHSVSDK